MDETAGWLCDDLGAGSFMDLRDEVAPTLVDDTMMGYSPSVLSLASVPASRSASQPSSRPSSRQSSQPCSPAGPQRHSNRLLARNKNVPQDSPLSAHSTSVAACRRPLQEIGSTPLHSRTMATSSKNVPCNVARPPPSVCRTATLKAGTTPMSTVRGSRLPVSEAKARGITFSLFKTPPKAAIGQTCRPVGPECAQEDKVLRRLSFSKLLAGDGSNENSAESLHDGSRHEDDSAEVSQSSAFYPTVRDVAPKRVSRTPSKSCKVTRAASMSATTNKVWREARVAKTPSGQARSIGVKLKLKPDDPDRGEPRAQSPGSKLNRSRKPSGVTPNRLSCRSLIKPLSPRKPISPCSSSFTRSVSKLPARPAATSNKPRPLACAGSSFVEKIEKKAQSRIDKVLGAVPSRRPTNLSRSLSLRRPGALRPSAPTNRSKSPQPKKKPSPALKKQKVKGASKASLFCAELR